MPQHEKCPHCDGTGKIAYSPVRALRLRAGLQGNDVAAKLGISQSTYSRIESGDITPLYQAGKLAALYGVSTDVILGAAPVPPPKKDRPHKDPPAAALASSRARRRQVAAKQKGKR